VKFRKILTGSHKHAHMNSSYRMIRACWLLFSLGCLWLLFFKASCFSLVVSKIALKDSTQKEPIVLSETLNLLTGHHNYHTWYCCCYSCNCFQVLWSYHVC